MPLFNLYETIKRAMQDVVAPELQAVRGDITALQSELQRVESTLSSRIAQVESTLNSRVAQVESTFDSRIAQVESTLDSRIAQVESTFSSRIAQVESTLDSRIAQVESNLTTRNEQMEQQLGRVEHGLEELGERLGRLEGVVGETQVALLRFAQDTEARFNDTRGEVAHQREVMDVNIRRLEERMDAHLRRIDNELGAIKERLQMAIDIHERLAALEAKMS